MSKKLLGDLVDIQGGYQQKSKVKENEEGKYFLIQGKNFNKHHELLEDELVAFMPERTPELYQVQKGDVLFQARGHNNFAYYVNREISNALASSTFSILRVKDATILDPAYLAWWLGEGEGKTLVAMLAAGSAMPNVSKKKLIELPIPLPPIEVQQKIAEVSQIGKEEQQLLREQLRLRAELTAAVCNKMAQDCEVE